MRPLSLQDFLALIEFELQMYALALLIERSACKTRADWLAVPTHNLD